MREIPHAASRSSRKSATDGPIGRAMPTAERSETSQVSPARRRGTTRDVRHPAMVRREIDALVERRAGLWKDGVDRADGVQAEVQALTRRIDELWLELRTISASLRAGSREQILQRAKRATRAEQELRRRLPIG